MTGAALLLVGVLVGAGLVFFVTYAYGVIAPRTTTATNATTTTVYAFTIPPAGLGSSAILAVISSSIHCSVSAGGCNMTVTNTGSQPGSVTGVTPSDTTPSGTFGVLTACTASGWAPGDACAVPAGGEATFTVAFGASPPSAGQGISGQLITGDSLAVVVFATVVGS